MKKNNKKIKVSLHKLFWDDRFVIVFSLVIAVIFWAAVCVSFSPNTTNVIKDVPIVIETKNSVPSQCGLQVFGDEDFTVDIKVSGSRYVVGENLLTAEDFTVTAVTSSVTTAGTHSLQIRVSKVNEDANFSIDEISESFISVYFDSLDKKDIPVTVSLNRDDFVKSGYMTDDNYIMDSKTVTVSGPALELAQLDSVIADVQITDDNISETQTYEASLTAYSENKTPLKYVKINGEDNAVMNVSVPIYQMASHPVDVEFTNVPSAYSKKISSLIDYKLSPSSLNVAVLQNGSENDEISVGSIDFSQIKSGENVFKFDIKNINTIKPDSTNVKKIEVSFDIDNVSSKYITLKLDNLSILNQTVGNIKFVDSEISVQLFGSESELQTITSENLTAKIDMDNNTSEDENIYKGPITISNGKTCWIYGTYELPYFITD